MSKRRTSYTSWILIGIFALVAFAGALYYRKSVVGDVDQADRDLASVKPPPPGLKPLSPEEMKQGPSPIFR